MQRYALSGFNPSILPFFNSFSCGAYTKNAAVMANLAITVAKHPLNSRQLILGLGLQRSDLSDIKVRPCYGFMVICNVSQYLVGLALENMDFSHLHVFTRFHFRYLDAEEAEPLIRVEDEIFRFPCSS